MAWKLATVGLFLTLLVSTAEGQIRLGDVPPGGQLRIALNDTLPLSRLRVEIDGLPVDVPLALSGGKLIVTLPDGLQGRDHDIVVYRRQPDADVELGIWTFSTRDSQTEAVFAGTLEIEQRRGSAGSSTVFNGNGRLGFSVGGDLLRGGIGFVQTGTARRGGVKTEVSDYFLETRHAVLGQDFIARLGTQGLPVESVLAEDQTWRGASLRLSDPNGRSDVLAFALNPAELSGTRNLTGLEDEDSRLAGVAAQVFPFGTSSFRADFLSFAGRADLSDGAAEVSGRGLRLSGPIGADLGDFSLEYAESAHGTGGDVPAASGEYLGAELGFALIPAGQDNSLELRLSGDRRAAGFYSPLNPDLIADEESRQAELVFQSDEWQWALSAEEAQSNIADNPALPTDRFRTFALDATYSPYVFTGGFLQGVTLYGSLLQEDQKRLITPEDGPAPQDFRLQSISFGMDRFQPDHSWALGLKLDWLEDLSGGETSERSQRIEASYAYTPDDLTTYTLRAEMGRSQTTGDWQDDATLEMSYAFPILDDLWSGYVEAGTTEIEGGGAKEGAYFGAEVKRRLSPATALLLRADYGQGAHADSLAPGAGWTFGLALRHEFGAATP